MISFTIAIGMAAATGFSAATRICAVWDLLGHARRAEAEAARLRDELRALRYAASHDPLTGLLNCRGFYELGETLLATHRIRR